MQKITLKLQSEWCGSLKRQRQNLLQNQYKWQFVRIKTIDVSKCELHTEKKTTEKQKENKTLNDKIINN